MAFMRDLNTSKNTGSLAKDKNAHETNAHEKNTHEINAHEGNKNIQEMKKNQKLMKYSDFKVK